MKQGTIVTIDGPSGAGKGTVARSIAKRLGLTYLDTGAMYRAVALLVLRNSVDINNEDDLRRMLLESHISLQTDSDHTPRVYINREDVSDEIRTPEISRLSSSVATKKMVRGVLRGLQRRLARSKNIVAEGRDMGTYVFPDADFKFFLDAALEERARRRWRQLKELGIDEKVEKVTQDMAERDRQDRERSESPLHPAPNAVIIDTTDLLADDVVERLIQIISGGL